jgi:hypothetical protein
VFAARREYHDHLNTKDSAHYAGDEPDTCVEEQRDSAAFSGVRIMIGALC